MSSAGPTAGAASNRHRPDEAAARDGAIEPAPTESAHGRGALIALGVAAIGTVAFAVGLRAALRHLPPERAAAAAVADSARRPRFAPPPPNQPDEYPRLR